MKKYTIGRPRQVDPNIPWKQPASNIGKALKPNRASRRKAEKLNKNNPKNK